MRTDIISFILISENRKKIVRTIFEYPKRQWSCSSLEDLAKISHSTVFRTLYGLRNFGILKTIKINKKDIIYELVIENPLIETLKRILDIGKITTSKIANNFINKIKSKQIYSAILYGSSITGDLKPESDIDILIILDKSNEIKKKKIQDEAANLSSNLNRTISTLIMDKKELNSEKNKQFIKSIKENMEVIYGKKPF